MKDDNGKIESASFHKLHRDVLLRVAGQVPFRFNHYMAHVIMEERGGVYCVLHEENIQPVFD